MIEQVKLSEWIERFNNNDLHGEELLQFAELLKDDAELRKEVLLDKELESVIGDEELLDLRKKILDAGKGNPGTSHLQLLMLAASVLVLTGLAVLLALYSGKTKLQIRNDTKDPLTWVVPETGSQGERNPGYPENRINPGNPTPYQKPSFRGKKGPRQLFAANYLPFRPYESLSGTVTRARFFRLDKPEHPVYQKGQPILFQWTTALDGPFELVIMNNKGKRIISLSGLGNEPVKVDSGRLPYGLFYFRIICNDSPVWFGKFETE